MPPQPNLFYPEMTHFAFSLHATREELIQLAADWADGHELHVSLERFFPDYLVAAIPVGGDIASAIAEFEPVRRICLRRDVFDLGSINAMAHLVRNPESFVMVLEPLTEDGLRATALTSRMGDEDALRWWVAIVRETAEHLHRGAWALDPAGGRQTYVADHWHTPGAHHLAAGGVPMLAAAGSAIFEFADLD